MAGSCCAVWWSISQLPYSSLPTSKYVKTERRGPPKPEEVKPIVDRQRLGGAQARPVARVLPVNRLPLVGRVVPLLTIADRRGRTDGRVQVRQLCRGLLRAARAVIERHHRLAVHRGHKAGHAGDRSLALIGGWLVEVEVVGTGPSRQAKQIQAGGLDHLLGLAGVQVRVPPGCVDTQQLGIDRAHHLAHVDAYPR